MVGEVYAFIFQSILQDGVLIFVMLTDPVLMALDECIKIANEVNNNADLPQVMMCMPPIVESGIGV